MPGAAREVSLHDQLYRYAEDLQQMIEQHGALSEDYAALQADLAALEETRTLLDRLVQASPDLHIITDAEGRVMQANPAAEAIAKPAQLAGSRLSDWIKPTQHAAFETMRTHALAEARDRNVCGEFHLCQSADSATRIIASVQVVSLRLAGEQTTLHWILRDITGQREREFDSRVSAMVFDHAVEGLMITDIEGVIIAVNPAFTRITGYAADEVVGRTPRLLNAGVQGPDFYAHFWKSLREQGFWQGQIFNRKKSGEVYPEWLTVNAVRDNDGNPLTYIAIFSDLSRLQQAEQRLSHLAHHDTLTGLPNRLLLNDRMAQLLLQGRRTGQPFSVIFIDLDRFKAINDSCGHEIGDRVLREAACRLFAAVRETDTVARFGGDEFVILAPALGGKENIGRVCEKIIEALALPIEIEGRQLSIGGSLGCAEYPGDGEDERHLLNAADQAMYRAKQAGGNGYRRASEDAAGPGACGADP